MKLSSLLFIRGLSWTVVAYGGGQFFRFVSNIVLTRLLTPELFGIIALVHSARAAIDLLTDMGIGQVMVSNKSSEHPDFYNTVWTIQFIRGIVLWLLSVALAFPLADFYNLAILIYLLPVAALPFLLSSATSLGPFIAQKRIQFVRLNVFDLCLDFISAAANIVAAIISPTVWALVSGLVLASAARAIGSYFIVPQIPVRLYISRAYALEILGFSKWILFASITFFLASNFDTLYLGKVSTLEILGIYGIARTLAYQLVAVINRLAALFVVPIITSLRDMPRAALRGRLAMVRGVFLFVTAAILSLIAASGDLLVGLLYDTRYAMAGSMLSILILGAWFTILCTINESTMLGLGKPSYNALGNLAKLIWLFTTVPLGYTGYGPIGVVIAVALSDMLRYLPVLVGQMREGFSFALQDLALTAALMVLVGVWQILRLSVGLGVTPV